MEVKLRKRGNNTVAVLPAAVLRNLGITVGQAMKLEATGDGRIVLTRKRKYALAELIAQCDPWALLPTDLTLWDDEPVGRKVW